MFERQDNTERYFADAHGVDDDAVAEGMRWLLSFATDRGLHRAAIFVPSLPQVESLGRAIGEPAATALRKQRRVQARDIALELLTERGLPHSFDQGPVLAVWVDDKQLDKLDALRAPGLCAIPWVRTDIDGWKTNWNPTDIRTGEQGGSDETVTNPVVAKALESLTFRVNLGTGLGHPSDKASAVQLFKALKSAHEDYDPDQVRAWAVRHGWSPDHARDLAELAQKVGDGRPVRAGKQRMWRSDIVKYWRVEAESE